MSYSEYAEFPRVVVRFGGFDAGDPQPLELSPASTGVRLLKWLTLTQTNAAGSGTTFTVEDGAANVIATLISTALSPHVELPGFTTPADGLFIRATGGTVVADISLAFVDERPTD